MVTKREFLAEKGLASANSRGRFSTAAKVELDRAVKAGMVFDDDKPKAVKKEKTVKPSKETKATVVSDYDAKAVRSWAKANGYEVGERGRIHANIVAAYQAANGEVPKRTTVRTTAPVAPKRETVRPETVAWGYARLSDKSKPFASEPLVAISHCGNCRDSIQYCKCKSGPVTPAFMGSEPAMLVKPTV